MNPNKQTPDQDSLVRRLLIFIALVNLAEGLGQVGGVINQPLVHFCKEALGWAPDQVTKFLAVLIIPWIIKPVYGLLSDFVPILGYRRRPYLIAANLLAVGGFLWMTGLTTPAAILTALFLTAFGMAASSTITEAVLVENGNKLGMSGKFLNAQWLWFNVAAITASLTGGWLAEHLKPGAAFHTAAWIAAAVPVAVALSVWFLIAEDKQKIQPVKVDLQAIGGIFKNKTMWITAGFLFLWNIVPSFGTPLYYHMSDDLKFSQQFIGILSAVSALGSVLGAFAYDRLAKRLKLAGLLYLSLALGVAGTLLYVFLLNPASAIAISFINGLFGMIALVSSLTVAAHAVPNSSAGFSFALLMSVNNLSGQLSTNLGAWMFVHMFHGHLNPVIYVAAVATAACALLVPILKLGDQGGNSLKGGTDAIALAKASGARITSGIARGF
jgi:MFS family permease